jgi:hypothetical protein
MAQTKFGGAVIKKLIAAQSTAITITGTALDCTALKGVVAVILNSGTASSGDTFAVTLECSDAVNGTFHTVVDKDGTDVAFTQITDAIAAHDIKYFDMAQRQGHPWIRAVATMATNGGTVACIFSVTLIGFPQYL